MKKITLVFAFLILAKLVCAQEFRFGLRLSPIVSVAAISDKDKNTISGISKSSKIGFAGGLMATYQFSEKFGVHSGLNIVSKGYEYELAFPTSTPKQTTKTTLTTVEIPVALHMRTNEIASGIRIRGIFGGSFNILASSKTDITVGGTTLSSKKSDDYYKIVPDFIVGAGVEWSLKDAGTVDLGLRFNQPLFLVTDKVNGTDGRIKVSYWSFDIGYYF
jgi:Outer membrane protein beta-barrel domain